MRAVLPACLLVVAVTAGCAGPLDDDDEPESFQRMQPFSVVLVGEGLLTAGPQAAADTTTTGGTAEPPALQLTVPDAAAVEAPELPDAVAAEVRTALDAAAPAIQRQTNQANRGLASGNGRSAAPALQRLNVASRGLAAKLAAIPNAPQSVRDLAVRVRGAANGARDLRTALLRGSGDAAAAPAARYGERAAQSNAIVAGLALEGWPADRRLFP